MRISTAANLFPVFQSPMHVPGPLTHTNNSLSRPQARCVNLNSEAVPEHKSLDPEND